ncbi:MAG: hypothetical protein A2Y67_00600 [Candidatus Buchananbacteria bacterium RBG_13_39_9]|uniref:Uncharacterized protein n=1 Tax=Candidatus Buchananbacteria bacterium RBG_13_39_9 TaxID=1797531 RepID=A0A1G1XNX5_9BACT|nr:MAG: hypothetical protein A2Y67_00600 [Candidatus Buchananbacteria bacterium RBG_13_39_9]
MKRIFFLLIIFFLALSPWQNVLAAGNLSNVGLSITPLNAGSLSSWNISFTVPEETELGHILISLGGYQPDLGSAELFVSGVPQGSPQVGKSNPNCVINCDDIRYYYNDPITIKKDTRITFTLNKIKNPGKVGQTGINFINLYSSKYPQTVLAYSAGEKLLNLDKPILSEEDNLIPDTATSEENEITALSQIMLNELFYQPGAKTTKLSAIKDPAKVVDFTLDLLAKEKIIFKGTIDLSKPESLKFLEKLGDYLTFDILNFEVKKELLDYFKVPLEITYYNLPYIWDPDVLMNEESVLSKDKLENYHYVLYDNKPQVSFVIKEAGSYKLIPHLEIYLEDNFKVEGQKKQLDITGRISDPKAIIKVNLNGKELKDLEVKIDALKGNFVFPVELVEGSNLLEIKTTSEYGDLAKIVKIIQYLPQKTETTQEKAIISPLNIAAIVLAIIAIILILAIRRLSKKRKR